MTARFENLRWQASKPRHFVKIIRILIKRRTALGHAIARIFKPHIKILAKNASNEIGEKNSASKPNIALLAKQPIQHNVHVVAIGMVNLPLSRNSFHKCCVESNEGPHTLETSQIV